MKKTAQNLFYVGLLLPMLALVLLIHTSSLAIANNDDFDALIRKAEQHRIAIANTMEESTVIIFYRKDDGWSVGTGFVVADGYVFTNGHVVEGGDNFYIAGKTFSPVQAKLIKMINDDQEDYAVLRFSPPVKLPILSFTYKVHRTDRVSAWGFPYAYTQFDRHTDPLLDGNSDKVPPVISTEGVVNAIINTGSKEENILHSANIASGNSGGPLINSRGQVVGVNTWGSKEEGEGSHVNAAITAKNVVAFIRSVGVEPQVVDAGQTYEPRYTTAEAQPAPQNNRFQLPNINPPPSGNDLTGDAKKLYPNALEGDMHAQAFVGLAYWEGELAPENINKAVYWLKKAVEQEENTAKAVLGIIYITNPDFKNVQEGVRLLKQSAQKDNDSAAILATLLYFGEALGINRDVEGALEAAQKGAKANDMDSIALLSLMYYTGDGVEADNKRALELAQKAEKNDNALAYAVLSWMYANGDAVPEDSKKAVQYAKKAIAKDESLGKSLLAMYYYIGQGVEQDYKQAFKYADEASDSLDEVGQYILGMLYANGEGVTQSHVKAWAYFDMAARKNVSDAGELRDTVAKEMDAQTLKEAQELVRLWHKQNGLTLQ